MTVVLSLYEQGLVQPPKWLPDRVEYLTVMGSMAYGVNTDTSDMDVYGFVTPPQEIVFPHLAGHILGFGQQPEKFEIWQQHHVKANNKEYDFSVYSIVRYFDLLSQNNPNMLDSIFTPDNCVLFQSPVAKMVRENRKLFLHKGAFHKFKGYAYAQIGRYRALSPNSKLGAIRILMEDAGIEWETFKEQVDNGSLTVIPSVKKDMDSLTERQVATIKEGVDRKAMYHVVRLINEVEQLLTEGDLDIQRNREQLKSIRRGEWTPEEIFDYFNRKEASLESLYETSTALPHSPDMKLLRQLLMNCLEVRYGSLANMVSENKDSKLLLELQDLVKRYK